MRWKKVIVLCVAFLAILIMLTMSNRSSVSGNNTHTLRLSILTLGSETIKSEFITRSFNGMSLVISEYHITTNRVAVPTFPKSDKTYTSLSKEIVGCQVKYSVDGSLTNEMYICSLNDEPVGYCDRMLVCYNKLAMTIEYYKYFSDVPAKVVSVPFANDLSDIVIYMLDKECFVLAVLSEHCEMANSRLYLVRNKGAEYIGEGCLPFLISPGKIGYISNNNIFVYNCKTLSSFQLADNQGQNLITAANPWYASRIIYDHDSNCIIYTAKHKGNLISNLFADDNWMDILVQSLTSGTTYRIGVRKWIYDIN